MPINFKIGFNFFFGREQIELLWPVGQQLSAASIENSFLLTNVQANTFVFCVQKGTTEKLCFKFFFC